MKPLIYICKQKEKHLHYCFLGAAGGRDGGGKGVDDTLTNRGTKMD